VGKRGLIGSNRVNLLKRLTHLIHINWHIWRIRRAKTEATLQVARHALAAQLANGRGLPMKVGQMLAGMQDDSAYKQLTQSITAWKLKEILPVLEQAWGMPVFEVVHSIEESQAAASLGQVHRARLKDGTEVAIKVQYLDIRQAIEAEMRIAGLMPRGVPVKRWDFDLDAYKNTLKENMLYELDYLHEMKQQQHFINVVHVEGLSVPSIVDHLCHHNVLVQSWVEGARLAEVMSWGQLQRLQIARTLMQTMFVSLFEIGLVHGDPHPGNMLFQCHDEKACMLLLDFGCMITISEERRMALLKLILLSRDASESAAINAFATLGFDPAKLLLIEDKLPSLMRILFRPFIEDVPFDLRSWHPGQESEALLAEKRWIFRAAGPADLFLLMRVFQGLVQQLISLDSKLPWWPILKQSISERIFEQSEKVKMKTVFSGETDQQSESHANTLHVRISESGEEIFYIELAATSAFELSEMMPESAKKILQKQGISLVAIEQSLLSGGLTPQDLINLRDGEKGYHVWLK